MMLHSMLRCAAALSLVPLSSGCVLAARQLVVAKHNSDTARRARRAFPAGTPIETARSGLSAQGYACADADGANGIVLTCDPIKRTGAIFKGNWRLVFTGADGRVLTARAVRSPKPKKQLEA